MEKKLSTRAATATALALFVGAMAASPAAAHGSTTWSASCGSFSANSWYDEPNDMGHAVTGANDGEEVGAAIRYYTGNSSYVTGYGYAHRTRAAFSYGGKHQSYCFPGTQTKST